jgi:hypothetical protein
MIIGTVVEGPTDRLVLEAVISKLLPGDHRFLPLQPQSTLGETGAGWKGVKRWCRQTWQSEGSSLETIIASVAPPIDLLVIHVDAEVAAEYDLQDNDPEPLEHVAQPCPPVAPTIAGLVQVIGRWVRCQPLPPEVVLAIPAQDIENWTFAALFSADALCVQSDYECTKTGIHRPCYKLTLPKYGKLLHRKGGEIKKPLRRYQTVVEKIAESWPTVCALCPQAQRFTEDTLRVGAGVNG